MRGATDVVVGRILVPVDFTPSSDAALRYALEVADACGADVEIIYVWNARTSRAGAARPIFADTPEGVAMEERLSAADRDHAARVSGRLEFGCEPSEVILEILQHEAFDLVVIGSGHGGGHVRASIQQRAPCRVVTTTTSEGRSDRSEGGAIEAA